MISSNKLRLITLISFAGVAYLLLAISSPPLTLPNTRLPASRLTFSQLSCHSRHNHHRKRNSSLGPSPYLLSKLRRYENLHHRCGPLSESFNRSHNHSTYNSCKYIVYTPSRGLGNRMLGLASTFLYALLTDRVLLVDFGANMKHLFCEPFPNSTWLLPAQSFPLKVYSYGNLLRKRGEQEMSYISAPSSVVQIFLHDTYDYDKLFFIDEKQRYLRGVPWLVLISTQYFVPALFQMQSFVEELDRWFPGEKIETVFYHLGNYLFNPSNQAWDIITAFYESNLAKAEERIGLQIRVFEPKKTPTSFVMMKWFLACTHSHNILPSTRNQSPYSSKAVQVQVASLSRKFYEEMKSKYSGSGGIGVYHASNEEKEHYGYGNGSHSMRAWVDMYLLSMSHVLVTSKFSTFGYVAAGLGGIRPWIVMVPRYVNESGLLPEPSCRRAVNTEPCFLKPPQFAYPDHDQSGPVARCEHAPSRGLKLVRAPRLP
ncbi:Galactoside 2-alpha-L-fucosyltransferase [Linum grandiflorum]